MEHNYIKRRFFLFLNNYLLFFLLTTNFISFKKIKRWHILPLRLFLLLAIIIVKIIILTKVWCHMEIKRFRASNLFNQLIDDQFVLHSDITWSHLDMNSWWADVYRYSAFVWFLEFALLSFHMQRLVSKFWSNKRSNTSSLPRSIIAVEQKMREIISLREYL